MSDFEEFQKHKTFKGYITFEEADFQIEENNLYIPENITHADLDRCPGLGGKNESGIHTTVSYVSIEVELAEEPLRLWYKYKDIINKLEESNFYASEKLRYCIKDCIVDCKHTCTDTDWRNRYAKDLLIAKFADIVIKIK